MTEKDKYSIKVCLFLFLPPFIILTLMEKLTPDQLQIIEKLEQIFEKHGDDKILQQWRDYGEALVISVDRLRQKRRAEGK